MAGELRRNLGRLAAAMGHRSAVVDHLSSLLFVPENALSQVTAARFGARADAVVLDLETAIVGQTKHAERRRVGEQLRFAPAGIGPLFVRVNAMCSAWFQDDLDLVAIPSLAGVVVPEWENWEDLGRLDAVLTEAEARRPEGSPRVEVILIIETDLGVKYCHGLGATATGCRAIAVAFGANDYAKDVGLELDWISSQLDEPRRAVLRAASCLSASAFDTAYPLDSYEGLRGDALRAKSLGFDGKFCKRPEHVAIVNEVFRDLSDEVAN